MARLTAIGAGARDPQRLAKLRTAPCPHDEAASAQAPQGPGRAEPLCA
jgi:hypothetical protein